MRLVTIDLCWEFTGVHIQIYVDVQILCNTKAFKMTTWLLWVFGTAVVVFGKDLTIEPGHLKPFGDRGPSHYIEELDYFPSAKEFFENYVKPSKPVKMTGAAKMSAAFGKWTDDYFLTLDEPSDHRIHVETMKKESRQQEVESMQFKQFVQMYNNTEHYMVNEVPSFLRHEIMIPCSLQCQHLTESAFLDNVMWYSSGGTKSVVHTDNVENINCLYRGEKTLIFVDPDKYADKVEMVKDSAYSVIDVDSVDYAKFPGMAEVEFYHVNITAGDCLYIPYMWIHQVRSYGSNLAVNIWWKHQLSAELDYTQCSEPCNPDMTLEHAVFHGLEELDDPLDDIRNLFISLVGDTGAMTLIQFVETLFEVSNIQDNSDTRERLAEAIALFRLLDVNKDRLVSIDEFEAAPDEIWVKVADIMDGVVEGEGAEQGIDIDGEDDEQTRSLDDDLNDERTRTLGDDLNDERARTLDDDLNDEQTRTLDDDLNDEQTRTLDGEFQDERTVKFDDGLHDEL